MGKLYLSSNDSDEINILKIIECIKTTDMKQGLKKEEIEYKYTHGWCRDFAFLVKRTFERVLGKKVELKAFDFVVKKDDGERVDCHYYVEFLTDKGKRFADILGIHSEQEVRSWIDVSNFMRKRKSCHDRIINGAKAHLLFENLEDVCLQNIDIYPKENFLE